MNDNLIERETLGQFADMLVAQKYPQLPDSEKHKIREQTIDALDERIGLAFFGSLTEEQLTEIERLLDNQDASEDDFEEFFQKNHIDLGTIIERVFENYKSEFLGGDNV